VAEGRRSSLQRWRASTTMNHDVMATFACFFGFDFLGFGASKVTVKVNLEFC